MGLAEILNRRKQANIDFYNDDIRVLSSTVEYYSDNRTLKNIIYEVEMLDRTGELRHFYKVIKLLRIIRLPKSAKQSQSFMDIHSQVLSGIWEQGINFITIIANMIEPIPLGLLFLYGVQGIAEDLEDAKRIADNDFAALCGLLQGSYRQMEFRPLNYDEIEWLREKMYSMKYLSVVRGLPKPRKGGTDFGIKGFGGTDPDPESQDTTEEFVAGMADKEYVIMVLSTPVEERVLREWLTQTAKEMTRWNSQMQGSASINFGISIPMMYMANLGASSGWSHGYSDAENVGYAKTHSEGQSFTESFSTSHGGSQSTSIGVSHSQSQGVSISQNASESHGISEGVSIGHGKSVGESMSISHTEGQNASVSVSHTEGTSYSYSEGENVGYSHSKGISESVGTSQTHTSGSSVTQTDSVNTTHGLTNSRSQTLTQNQSYSRQDGYGSSWGRSQSTSHSTSGGFSVSVPGGVFSGNRGVSDTNSVSSDYSNNVSHSVGQTTGRSVANAQSQSESFSNSVGHSLGKTQSVSDSIGINESRGINESWSDSYGESRSQSWGASTSDSITNTRGVSVSDGWTKGISQSESIEVSRSQSSSQSVSRGYSVGENAGVSQGINVSQSQTSSWSVTRGFSKGQSVSDSVSNSWGRTQGVSFGSSGSISQATSATMGVGPSISFSKSFQWLDIEVQNIVTLLQFQNDRLMKALNGNGAFFTDVYIATPNEEAKSAAQALAKSAWFDKSAFVCPLQVMNLTEEEQSHLLYHFNAFSADTTMEGIPGKIGSYKYSTILLPEEQAAFTHPPRISEGGVFADVLDVPKFAVPSMRKGEIYMGKILSGERWTQRWGYVTPFDYRISSDEIMHAVFTGESRSGKTVAATRFIAELANKVRRKNGKRMRIVCMDPKQDWRILAKFIEPERFSFYSLGNPEFLPINLNVCKIPHNVYPQQWIDGIIEIYCRAYGLGERGKSVLAESFYELYEEAGVFVPNWKEVAPERSKQVTLPKVYERMKQKKIDLEDPRKSGKGRIGNDVRDAYSRVLDRLQVFGRPFSIEAQLFGREDGMGIDDLIGKDDVVVLESYGLETTFKNFIFGCITSGFFKYAQAHEGGFLAPDQYETVLVIEEANEVLTGQDTSTQSNVSPLPGQSEFEKILDQAAGLGLFIVSITQKIADMPSSVVANSGLIFAGKISRQEDVSTVIRKIGREERYDDRDLVKWFPRAPIGWFVCRSSRNYDFKESEPVLVKIEPLDVKPPTNEELLHIMALKEAAYQSKKTGV